MGCAQSSKQQNEPKSTLRKRRNSFQVARNSFQVARNSFQGAFGRQRQTTNYFALTKAVTHEMSDKSRGDLSQLEVGFPMYVAPTSQLKQLQQFVPYEEALEAGVIEKLDLTRGQLVIFWSHEWLGRDHPDPDNVQFDCVRGFLSGVAAGPEGLRRLLEKSQHTVSASNLFQGMGMLEQEFVQSVCNGAHWIDYLCVPQDTSSGGATSDQASAISSIAGYAARSDLMIVLCPPAVHNLSCRHCDLGSWRTRGWCRLELLAMQWTHDNFPVMVSTAPDELRIGADLMAKKMKAADSPLNGKFSCCDFDHVIHGRTMECDKFRLYQCLECLHHVRVRGVLKLYGVGLQWRWVMAMRPLVLSGLDDTDDNRSAGSSSKPIDTSLSAFLDEYQLRIEETDEVENTPLHWAAFLGNSQAVRELLGRGDGLQLRNARNRREMHQDIRIYSLLAGGGTTPTILAAERGCTEIVEALADANADVNAETLYGATALNLASTRGHANTVEFLLKRGAQVDVPLNEKSTFFGHCIGFTPLHSAAIEGHEQVVRLLLAGRSNAILRSMHGATPLHCSVAFQGRVGVVQALLASKANVRARCYSDYPVISWQSATARDVAVGQGFTEIVQALIDAEILWL